MKQRSNRNKPAIKLSQLQGSITVSNLNCSFYKSNPYTKLGLKIDYKIIVDKIWMIMFSHKIKMM